MSIYSKINHPRLHAPGISQEERLLEQLNPDNIKIDDRTMVDLLDFIFQMSKQVKYYHLNLEIKDWQAFFRKSLAFQIAHISKINTQQLENTWLEHEHLLEEQSVPTNLQLVLDFLYYELLLPIAQWQEQLQQHDNGLGRMINHLIATNLRSDVAQFIYLSNGAKSQFHIQTQDFRVFQRQEIWGLDFMDLFSSNLSFVNGTDEAANILNLQQQLASIFYRFLEVIKELAHHAPDFLAESFIPLKEEFREKHPPHLGLLFTFLNLFQKFQADLNQLTSRHLDFFYQEALKIVARKAVPDQAHLVLGLQKNTPQYFLQKGLLFQDGKDANDQDILFALEEDIVLDKARIASLKTLFLNHIDRKIEDLGDATRRFVEGIYTAPTANFSDGIGEEAFKNPNQDSWSTLGAKDSKFVLPKQVLPQPHPAARIGFVLASPVLLLQEGQRVIEVELDCDLGNNLDMQVLDFEKLAALGSFGYCVNSENIPDTGISKIAMFYLKSLADARKYKIPEEEAIEDFSNFWITLGLVHDDNADENSMNELNALKEKLSSIFLKANNGTIIEYYINYNTLFESHIRNWFENEQESNSQKFEDARTKLIGFVESAAPVPQTFDIGGIEQVQYFLDRKGGTPGHLQPIFSEDDKVVLLESLKDKKKVVAPIFEVALSGVEEWIYPENIATILEMIPTTQEEKPCLKITLKIELSAETPAVHFFQKEVLLEDYDTDLPVAKIELSSNIKFTCTSPNNTPACELERCQESEEVELSPYHFLRCLSIKNSCIRTTVCGLKNIIVQNDENIQNINELIYPFGVRPTVDQVTTFIPSADPDLKGSNFFIGSREVFCKDWEKVWVNINWKDKPNSFKEYYYGYRDVLRNIEDIQESDFHLQLSVLEDFIWRKELASTSAQANPYLDILPEGHRQLFNSSGEPICVPIKNAIDQRIEVDRQYFDVNDNRKTLDTQDFTRYTPSTRSGFLRMTLKNQDFQHNRYAFILARQMMAFGKFPDEFLHGAVYYSSSPDANFNPVDDFRDVAATNLNILKLQLTQIGEMIGEDNETDNRLFKKVCDIVDALKDGAESASTFINDLYLAIELEINTIINEAVGSIKDTINNQLTTSFNPGGQASIWLSNIRTKVLNVFNRTDLITSTTIETITDDVEAIFENIDIEVIIERWLNSNDINSIKSKIIDSIQVPFNDFSISTTDRNTITNRINIVFNNHLTGTALLEDWLSVLQNELSADLNTLIISDINEVVDTIDNTFNGASGLKATAYETLNDFIQEDFLSQFSTRLGFIINQIKVNIQVEVKEQFDLLVDGGVVDGNIQQSQLTVLKSHIDSIIHAAFGGDAGFQIGLEEQEAIKEMIENKIKEIFDIENLEDKQVFFITQEVVEQVCGPEVIDPNAPPLIAPIPDIPEEGQTSQAYTDYLEQLKSQSLKTIVEEVKTFIATKIETNIVEFTATGVVIPNEPYTPIIKNISLDYTAKANQEDIQLIHLHPFDNTYQKQNLNDRPTLLPTFADEGTLFIGLEQLTKGNNLHLLFQLAEATADSESDKADIQWHYLINNEWVELRPGFEIISDETNELTTSGMVKIALPADISKAQTTIMPSDLYWIKVATRANVAAVAETVGIHTQAAKVTFQVNEANDTERLAKALAAEQINKLAVADSSIKEVKQPYPSFGGRPTEARNNFYLRVSEQLRHKGRAVASFDYERLVLDRFSAIFRVKCIQHSLGLSARKYRKDLALAPGFVLMAVVPNLEQLTAANALEPRVPLSFLEQIEAFLKTKTSPFVRFKAMNPRYEKVHIQVEVALYKGKSEAFFKAQLEQDLRHFLAPWLRDGSDKLLFGKTISKSDIIRFIEEIDYVDYITHLDMQHEEDLVTCYEDNSSNGTTNTIRTVVEPQTARSILTSGDIEVGIFRKVKLEM